MSRLKRVGPRGREQRRARWCRRRRWERAGGQRGVRSSRRAATFSVDTMARVERCGWEADGWIEEMVLVGGELGHPQELPEIT